MKTFPQKLKELEICVNRNDGAVTAFLAGIDKSDEEFWQWFFTTGHKTVSHNCLANLFSNFTFSDDCHQIKLTEKVSDAFFWHYRLNTSILDIFSTSIISIPTEKSLLMAVNENNGTMLANLISRIDKCSEDLEDRVVDYSFKQLKKTNRETGLMMSLSLSSWLANPALPKQKIVKKLSTELQNFNGRDRHDYLGRLLKNSLLKNTATEDMLKLGIECVKTDFLSNSTPPAWWHEAMRKKALHNVITENDLRFLMNTHKKVDWFFGQAGEIVSCIQSKKLKNAFGQEIGSIPAKSRVL